MPEAERPRGRRRRRLWIALAAVAVLVVGIRLALPSLVRSQLESQLEGLLLGTVTVGDVDLSLTRGAVAVEDVVLRVQDAEPDVPPLVAFRRLAVNLGWLDLFRRTIRIEDVTLVDLGMRLDRLPDGTFVLPGLRETEVEADADAEAEEPAPEPAAQEETPKPWAILIDHTALVGGRLVVRDFVVEPVEQRVVELPTLEVHELAFQPRPDGEPGRGNLLVRVDKGTVELRTRITPRREGMAVDLWVRMSDIPLDRLHVHAPTLGWSGSKGRLSLEARARVGPDGMPRFHGSITLRDLVADVAGEEGPAFLAKRLAVDIEHFSLLDRQVHVSSVALDGGELVVEPLAAEPLPLLRGRAEGGGEKPSAPPGDSQAGEPAATEANSQPAPAAAKSEPADAPGEGAEARPLAANDEPPADAAAPAATPPVKDAVTRKPVEPGQGGVDVVAPGEPVSDASERPWHWRVDEVTLSDALVHLRFESDTADVQIPRVDVRGASSRLDEPLEVDAELAVSDGTLTAKGTVVPQPLAADLDIEAAGVGLGRLAGATGMVPVSIDGAALDAELALAFGTGPLAIEGTLSLAETALTVPDDDAFAAGWEGLSVGVRSLEVPGLLDATLPAGAPPPSAPVALALDTVTFSSPRLLITRRDDGIVLPAVAASKAAGEPATEEVPQKEVGEQAREIEAEKAATTTLTLARFEMDDGEITWQDESLKPPYRGTFEDVDLQVIALEFPENVASSVTLSLRGPEGGKVSVACTRKGNDLNVDLDLQDLRLPQFNPYMKASGYALREGVLSLKTQADLAEKGFDVSNHIDLDDLELGGAGVDSFFEESVGLPTSVVIGLLKDTKGRISLDIPLEGDRERGVQVRIGPIIAQALTRAIIGALVSPLKLLGAVTQGKDGRIEKIQPSPVVFRPGTVDVSGRTEKQLAVLGKGLSLARTVGVVLQGHAGEQDRQARKEAAVLADLGAEPGFLDRVRRLGSGDEREAIQAALQARARGKKGRLEPEYQQQLDEWLAEKSVSDAELATLAEERAEHVRSLLVDQYGVDEGRIRVEPPVVDEAEPAVDVVLAPEGS